MTYVRMFFFPIVFFIRANNAERKGRTRHSRLRVGLALDPGDKGLVGPIGTGIA